MKNLLRGGVVAITTVSLAACSSGATDQAASSAAPSPSVVTVTETATAVATTSATKSTRASEPTEVIKVDTEHPYLTAPMKVVEEPYTNQELFNAMMVTMQVYNAVVSGNHYTSCLHIVDTSMPDIVAILGGQQLQNCYDSAVASIAAQGTPLGPPLTTEQLSIEDLGGGYAVVYIDGEDTGLRTVKLNNGLIYQDRAPLTQ